LANAGTPAGPPRASQQTGPNAAPQPLGHWISNALLNRHTFH
jgi:hypothetical protein